MDFFYLCPQFLKDRSNWLFGYQHSFGNRYSNEQPSNENQHSNERTAKILQRALSCKAISDLYDLANKKTKNLREPYISLQFVEKTEFGAQYITKARRIELDESLSDDMALSNFVFELTNDLNAPKHYKLFWDLLYFKINPETYAKECERVEYEGTIRHHEIIKSAIKEKGWDKSLDKWGARKIEDFDKYWETTLKFSSHANYWRKAGKSSRNDRITLIVTTLALILTITSIANDFSKKL